MRMERVNATSVLQTPRLSLPVLQIFHPVCALQVRAPLRRTLSTHFCCIGHYRNLSGVCVTCLTGATCAGGDASPVASLGFFFII